MVPICDIAFMPAKLKHTNEIYVHVGDGHFIQRTAAECQPIIQRRKAVIQENLKNAESKLEKQLGMQNLFNNEMRPA